MSQSDETCCQAPIQSPRRNVIRCLHDGGIPSLVLFRACPQVGAARLGTGKGACSSVGLLLSLALLCTSLSLAKGMPEKGSDFDYSERRWPATPTQSDPALTKRLRELAEKIEAAQTPALRGWLGAPITGDTAVEGFDGVERVFVPCREIARSELSPAASTPRSSGPYLWAGRRFVACLPSRQSEGHELDLIDRDLRVKRIGLPAERFFRFSRVPSESGILLTESSSKPERDVWQTRIHKLDADGSFREVAQVDVRELFADVDNLRTGSTRCVSWGRGYAVVVTAEEPPGAYSFGPWHTKVVLFDPDFRRLQTFETPCKQVWAAVACGSDSDILVLLDIRGYYFMRLDGSTHFARMASDRSPPDTGNRLAWAAMRIPYEAGRKWHRAGIVRGSRYFTYPREDMERSPVFDTASWPPVQVHTYAYGGSLTDGDGVVLIEGTRLYGKGARSSFLDAWDLTGKELTEPPAENRYDGGRIDPFSTPGDGKPYHIWRRLLHHADNRRQLSLGYWKGNIIVPGKANIFFVDEDTGLVNYRFCTIYRPGNRIIPSREWCTTVTDMGMSHGIQSYAVFRGHILGCTSNRREPIYVWKIPDRAVRRKE